MTNFLKEGEVYSFTRLLALIGFTAFLLGSAYLIYKGTTWGNYETFATFTGGGGIASQVANKFINSKYNTPLGTTGKQVGGKDAE